MAKSVTSEKLVLGTASSPARLSFPRLFTPKSFTPGQPPRFEATFLLDPSNADHKVQLSALKQAINKLIEAKWGANPPKDIKFCVGNGNDKEYDGYKDRIFVRSASKHRPVVADRGRNELTVDSQGQEPKIPYAGSYVIGKITLWAQDNAFGRRINSNLIAVQYVKDGTPFGPGSTDAETEFEALPEEAGSAPASGGAIAEDDDLNF